MYCGCAHNRLSVSLPYSPHWGISHTPTPSLYLCLCCSVFCSVFSLHLYEQWQWLITVSSTGCCLVALIVCYHIFDCVCVSVCAFVCSRVCVLCLTLSADFPGSSRSLASLFNLCVCDCKREFVCVWVRCIYVSAGRKCAYCLSSLTE